MQPVSVIAPFNQVSNAQSLTTSSTKLLQTKPIVQNNPETNLQSRDERTIKRNQSFHGFNNTQSKPQFRPVYNISGNINNAYSMSQTSLQSYPSRSFQYLAVNSGRPISRNNSLSGSFSLNMSIQSCPPMYNIHPPNLKTCSRRNSLIKSPQSNRVLARQGNQSQTEVVNEKREVQFIRRTASGIILPEQQSEVVPQTIKTTTPMSIECQNMEKQTNNVQNFPVQNAPTINLAPVNFIQLQNINKQQNNIYTENTGLKRIGGSARSSSTKLATIVEKRFGSLNMRKHRCYSPTFYSMRCKKHAKKRPIIVALPKKCFSELALSRDPNDKYENLTDSIQIFEENSPDKTENDETPMPAPRCKKHNREIVYANVNKCVNKNRVYNDDAGKYALTKITTTVDLHVVNKENSDTTDGITLKPDQEEKVVEKSSEKDKEINKINFETKEKNPFSPPSKTTPVKPVISTHALKNSPILKVSPNFIKPMNESPKGALSLQLQAKIKGAPSLNVSGQSIKNSPNTLKQPDESTQPNIVDQIKKFKMSDDDTIRNDEHCSNVPSMPLLNPQNMWSSNQSNANMQVCFFLFLLSGNTFLRIGRQASTDC